MSQPPSVHPDVLMELGLDFADKTKHLSHIDRALVAQKFLATIIMGAPPPLMTGYLMDMLRLIVSTVYSHDMRDVEVSVSMRGRERAEES
jgi:hypothetical protein